MIFVEGKQIFEYSCSSQGCQLVLKLLQHPFLSSLTNTFKSLPVMNIAPSIDSESTHLEGSSSTKFVYVFQREYTTVDSKLVEVHLIGGYDDTSDRFGDTNLDNVGCMISESHGRDSSILTDESAEKLAMNGYSWPLCSRIVESLQSMHYNFHVQTLCILSHNTVTGPSGFACPIIRGCVVNTIIGTVMPASFDRSARCPDEVVRRVRVSVSSGDPTWEGRLLETYDTHTDRFIIAPCKWELAWSYYAANLLQLSDFELLQEYSTSPHAESPDFVDAARRVFSYLLKNPNWKTTFPKGQPRIFTRTSTGGWLNYKEYHGDE